MSIRCDKAFMLILTISLVGITSWRPALAASNWERFLGGVERDTAFALASDAEGGVVTAGYTRSSGKGDADIWVFRLDQAGKMLWEKTWGATGRDMATAVTVLKDGGIAVAAVSQLPGSSSGDAMILRLDKKGALLWKRVIGGPDYDIPYAIKAHDDGRIVVAGYTKSSGAGDADGWVFTLGDEGQTLWQKTFGGKHRDWLRSLVIMPDKSLAMVGATLRDKKVGNSAWILRLNENGEKLWEKTYNSSENVARALVPTKDGGYVVSGWTRSKGGITGRDIWVVRLKADGEKMWEKKLGGVGEDLAESLALLPNGDFAIAGSTKRNLAVITVHSAWMIRLGADGKLIWERSFEGKSDQIYAIASLANGHIAAAGGSWRNGKGSDAWVLSVPHDKTAPAKRASAKRASARSAPVVKTKQTAEK